MPALLALVAVTAVWGLTFVQVKDALELYPLFAFLAVRFAIASLMLAVPARRRVRTLGRRGWTAGAVLGLLLAAGYGLQTAGLERTTVSSTGFVTGLYVVFTPLLALLLFRARIAAAVWIGVGALARPGCAALRGRRGQPRRRSRSCSAAAAVYSGQIVLMERYAPHVRCRRADAGGDGGRLRGAWRSSRSRPVRSSCRGAGRCGPRSSSRASSPARSASSSRRGRSGARARRGRRSPSRWSRSRRSSASGSPATASARSAGPGRR